MPAIAVSQQTDNLLSSADRAMQAGQFADAAHYYRAWLKMRPDSKQVLFALGVCYLQLRRHKEAVAVLRKYVRLVPESAAGHAALGIALLDGTETAEAKAELEIAIKLNPRQLDAVEALARVHLIEGNADKAVALLQPLAASATGEETPALLGDALIKAGQASAAAAMLDRYLQANPRSTPQIYATTASAHLKAGNIARAAELCEQGMRIYPDSEIAAIYLALPAPFLAERVGARIERLQQKPDAAEMIALGRILLDADPARKTRAGEIARQLLAHAIALAPSSALARYHYGRALGRISSEQALAEWERALALSPSEELRLHIYTQIARSKCDLADFDGAEQAFQAALEINRRLPSPLPDAALEYVRFLQLRSRPAEAEALLNETLSWNPLSAQAHLELAKLLAARGQWKRVIVEGEFVLRNAEGDEELLRAAHMLLARAYYRLNQPEKAQWHRARIESQ